MFELTVIVLLVLIVLGLVAVYSTTSRELSVVNCHLNELRADYLNELKRQKNEREALEWSAVLKETKRRFEEDVDRGLKEGSLKLEETADGKVLTGDVVCGVCRKPYGPVGLLTQRCPHCWESFNKDLLESFWSRSSK